MNSNIKQKLKNSVFFRGFKMMQNSITRLRTRVMTSMSVLKFVYKKAQKQNEYYNIHLKKHKTLKHIPFEKIESAVLVHSHRHFHPGEDIPTREYYYSSTASIGRHIWQLLGDKKKIFINMKNPVDYATIPKVDLVIGLMSENFRRVALANPQARKVLLLVNCHPLYRAKVLIKESERLGKPIPSGEWVDPNLFQQIRPHIDSIFLIGNSVIKDTYLEYGVDEIPITPVSLGSNDILMPRPELRPKDKIRFMYVATDMGIRKGFFRMVEAWKMLNTMVDPSSIELILLGHISFHEETEQFMKEYKNTTFISPKPYHEFLPYMQSSHIVLGPTLEEGQVGWILETMACGAVPIISKECGITITDGKDGFFMKNSADPIEMSGLMKKLIDDAQLRESMSKATLVRIKRDHTWEIFRENVQKIIES